MKARARSALLQGKARRALILAAGAGTRMQAAGDPGLTVEQSAAAAKGDKAFMPVAGRHFIDFLVDGLHSAGIDEVSVVVGAGREISGDFKTQVQAKPLGTANAVLSAEAWADGEPFLVLNGDNLYPSAAIAAVSSADGPALAGFDRDDLIASGNIPADRINAFAVVGRDEQGNLTRIIEKPTAADVASMRPPILVSMNLWRFDARIFDACRLVAPSARGELELPSAVMLARERGVDFLVIPAAGPVLDLSSRADIADVARRLGAAT